jgi:lactate permease
MLDFLLSLIPLITILVLMLFLRWGAARAGSAGYFAALVLAVLYFGSGLKLIAYAHVKAMLLTVDVLMIIWAAFLLYRVADEAGAIRVIGQALPHLTADRGMQALLIGYAFSAFIQGVGGFGVPVAVIAPILVGLHFTPLAAVVIPSLGHSWSVTFGSLGSSFQALIAATGQPAGHLGGPAAIFLGIAALVAALMVVHAAGGWQAVKRLVIPALALGLVMATTQYLVVISGPWNIGAFLSGVAGLLFGIPLARRYRGENRDNGRLDGRALLVAVSGYAVMVTITLAVQLIPPVKAALSSFTIHIDFPELATSRGFVTAAGPGRIIPLFSHPGALLTYASLLAYWIYRRAGLYTNGAARRIANGTLRSVLSSSVGIASMVAMSVVMQHASMTDVLARGLAAGAGAFFPLFSPWIGALGAFMTGSNTNSNVLFGALQLRTAELLGLASALILAAQTAGGSLGSIIAPTKVIVGASTAGMEGREGEVMRHLLVYTGILLLVISLATVAGIWLVGR